MSSVEPATENHQPTSPRALTLRERARLPLSFDVTVPADKAVLHVECERVTYATIRDARRKIVMARADEAVKVEASETMAIVAPAIRAVTGEGFDGFPDDARTMEARFREYFADLPDWVTGIFEGIEGMVSPRATFRSEA